MPIRFCRHIKTTGLQCQAVALREERFCYFHAQLGRQHRNFRSNHVYDRFVEPGRSIRLNSIEDRESLMMALSQTVGAIATSQIDLRQGIALLYGFQLLSNSMKQFETRNTPAPSPEDLVQSVVKSVDHLYIAPDAPEAPILEGEPSQLR